MRNKAPRMKRHGYNGRKKCILAALADGRARTVLEIAHGSSVGILRAGSLYHSLDVYARWGLLRCERRRTSSRSGPRQVAAFRITAKGRNRLRWLRQQGGKDGDDCK